MSRVETTLKASGAKPRHLRRSVHPAKGRGLAKVTVMLYSGIALVSLAMAVVAFVS